MGQRYTRKAASEREEEEEEGERQQYIYTNIYK